MLWNSTGGVHFNRNKVAKIQAVTLEDVSRVARKYWTPLLDLENNFMVMGCNAKSVDRVVKGFKENYGVDILAVDDIEDSPFAA